MRGVKETTEKIAIHYFEWKSEKNVKMDEQGHAMLDEKKKPIWEYDGYFHYFDKNIGAKGENVKVPFPFRFIPLEVLGTIKGFNDEKKCGVYSNEVKFIGKEELSVKLWKGGEFAKGLYKDIKGEIQAKGGKYGNSVYIGFFIGGNLEICNIQIHGASLSPFIEYGKTHKNLTEKGAMQVKGFKEETTGDNTYAVPIFEELEISDETNVLAEALGVKLKEYLDEYFKKGKTKGSPDALDTAIEEDEHLGMKPNQAATIASARPPAPAGYEYNEDGDLIETLPF